MTAPRLLLPCACLLGSVVLVPVRASAQPLFPERYVACQEDKPARPARPRPGREPKEQGSGLGLLEPLPIKHAPSLLAVEPLLVIDVTMTQPIPTRKPEHAAQVIAAPAEPEEPVLVVASGRNDYRCIGYPRGKPGIVRVVSAPPGTRWYDHGEGEDYRQENMRAAGAFNTREATRGLARALERPVPAGEVDYRVFETLDLKLTAARALADLEDRASAPRIVAFLREREGKPAPYPWRDALEPLQRLDPALAQAYANEVLGRVAERASQGEQDEWLVREVLPFIVSPSTESLGALARLSPPLDGLHSDGARHDACELLAARLRAGDSALRDELRPELDTDLRTSRAVYCYSEVIGLAFAGEDPDEVPALLLRHRYREIVHLLALMREREGRGVHDARNGVARQKIEAWLREQSGSPEIAAGQSDTRYDPIARAHHLVALSLLGDGRAKAELDALVADPKDDGVAPWIAAEHMLSLDLDGAADRAAERLGIAIKSLTENHSTKLTPERGLMRVTEHVRVIDLMARRGDARFSLGLLDRQLDAREAALYYLARLRPPQACALVAQAAPEAEEHAIQDAFWALSALGTECRPSMELLALDSSKPAEARGMAIELLAMMRAPLAAELSRAIDRNDWARAAKERARIIVHNRE